MIFLFIFLQIVLMKLQKTRIFSLKLSNIVLVHKKKDATDKASYSPVSILPLLSKVFEKVTYIQIYDYIEDFLNQLLCGFRKALSTQHALFRLIQSW